MRTGYNVALFNLSKWIARRVTGPGDLDCKIFIVGPAGSGKSKTGIMLALAIAKWISFYTYGDFSHVAEYFSLDEQHIACIVEDDIVKMLLQYPPLNCVRIVDDAGFATGINSRRSMSNSNIGLGSIWGTNRTRRGVLIMCMQDADFADVRMRMLSDVVIDLRDYHQAGPFRMGKLWHVKMNKASGTKTRAGLSRFMTFENGTWVTQESLAVWMPPPDICKLYDTLRAVKDRENADRIKTMFTAQQDEQEQDASKPKCLYCGKSNFYYGRKGTRCKSCGRVQDQ